VPDAIVIVPPVFPLDDVAADAGLDDELDDELDD
jgi:hypothetical protein